MSHPHSTDAQAWTCPDCLALPGTACDNLPDGSFHASRIEAAVAMGSEVYESDALPVTDKLLLGTGLF